MINNLENKVKISLENYKQNDTQENKDDLSELLGQLDKEYTKSYLEELKKYSNQSSTIDQEEIRIKMILEIIRKRANQREEELKIIKELSLENKLEEIPNIEKEKSFNNKLKVIELVKNILSKLNESNKEKAFEILNRKECKIILLEFSLITNEKEEEIKKLIDITISKSKESKQNKNSKLKILNTYYKNKKDFPDLNIPNMGLIEDENILQIDSNSIFVN